MADQTNLPHDQLVLEEGTTTSPTTAEAITEEDGIDEDVGPISHRKRIRTRQPSPTSSPKRMRSSSRMQQLSPSSSQTRIQSTPDEGNKLQKQIEQLSRCVPLFRDGRNLRFDGHNMLPTIDVIDKLVVFCELLNVREGTTTCSQAIKGLPSL